MLYRRDESVVVERTKWQLVSYKNSWVNQSLLFSGALTFYNVLRKPALRHGADATLGCKRVGGSAPRQPTSGFRQLLYRGFTARPAFSFSLYLYLYLYILLFLLLYLPSLLLSSFPSIHPSLPLYFILFYYIWGIPPNACLPSK